MVSYGGLLMLLNSSHGCVTSLVRAAYFGLATSEIEKAKDQPAN